MTRQHALDDVLPPGVASWLSEDPASAPDLGPLESAAAEHFSPARRSEFRHGRHCARRAMARLGLPPGEVGIGPQREPLWPAGIVGSITHAGVRAAAAIGRDDGLAAIGIDLEDDDPLEAALVARICRPEEIDAFAARGADAGRAARATFCAKEAAYKALWPLQRRFLEFQDLSLAWSVDGMRFSVVATSDRSPRELVARIAGRLLRGDGWLFSAALIAR